MRQYYSNNAYGYNNNNNNGNNRMRGTNRRQSQRGYYDNGYNGNYVDSYGTRPLYGNNNNNDTSHRSGSQHKTKAMVEDHVTIECEKLKETVDDLIDTISDFADIFVKRQKYTETDLLVLNDSTVQGLNMFSMILRDKMKKSGHLEFLKLAEHHLYSKIDCEFANKKQALNFVKPFIEYMKFVFQEAIKENPNAIEMIPRIETKAANWNEKSVNQALSLYLGSSHVADDNLEMYKRNRLDLKKKQQETLRMIEMEKSVNDDIKMDNHEMQLEMPKKEEFYQFLKPKGVVFKASNKNQNKNKKLKKKSKMRVDDDDDDDNDNDNGYSSNNHYKNNKNNKKNKKKSSWDW